MAPATLTSETTSVTCDPAQGFAITSILDRASGAEALWVRRAHAPAPCSRALGPAGEASIDSFLDVFVGGWFEMFPVVGYPTAADAASLLHGELVRLPWAVVAQDFRSVEAEVRTVRGPFRVRRRLDLDDEELLVTGLIEHVGAEPARYAWGQHPCFSRATFAGGHIELDLASATVPAPSYDPAAAILEPDRALEWPTAALRSGGTIDVGAVPETPDGRVDHVQTVLRSGRLRVTAPRFERALRLDVDLETYPYLLLWQNFAAQGGWPFWGDADTFALEPSSNPGRTMPDAEAAGAVRTLEPGATVETAIRVAWEPLG